MLRRRGGTLVSLAAVVVGLAAWQGYAYTQPAYLFPDLLAIASAFVEQIRDYDLLASVAASVTTLLAGFTIAAVVGIGTGLMMGLDERVAVMLEPYVNALYVAPIAALVPVIILVGGVNLSARIFVVFLFAVFEIIVDTFQGVKTTPTAMLDVARSFGARRWFTIKNVVVPHSVPLIFVGLRLGMGRAVRGVIIAELLVQFSNLGEIIRFWQNDFRIAGIISVVLVLMALGILLTRLVKMVEDRTVSGRSGAHS